MKVSKRLLALALALGLVVGLAVPAMAEGEEAEEPEPSEMPVWAIILLCLGMLFGLLAVYMTPTILTMPIWLPIVIILLPVLVLIALLGGTLAVGYNLLQWIISLFA